LQLELTELQYDSILQSSFNQEAFITFASISVLSVPSAQNLASVFGSTYTSFSCMKQNKLMFCSRITNVHLYDVMQIVISNMEPNVNSLVGQRKAQVSYL
jgi:hypothetical protein